MTSSPAYAAPVPAERTTANFFVAAVIFALFVIAALVSAERKDITQGFDEVAHVSYVAEIQHTGSAWPDLEKMHLLDPRTFQFTAKHNYLNHPPSFYALLAFAGPALEGHPGAVLADRLIDIAIAACGFAALLGLALAARLPRYEFYAYAVPLACIPVLVPIAGAVNNDNLAFLGGALTLLGAWQMLASDRGGWLALALVGVIVAGWAKLTGLALTGAMASIIMVYLIWRRRWRWPWTIGVALAFLVAAAPYILLMMQYGSPAPVTVGQIAMLKSDAQTLGLDALPRKSFAAYLGYFVVGFIVEWMPALSPRSVLNYAMLAIPVAALICALAGAALSLRRLWRRQETALDVVTVAGMASVAATFALHVRHSYADHLATGWLMEAYPRYYLPLVAVVPLAGLSLLAAVQSPRRRAGLLAFLVASPIVFRIFGAPLG